MSWKLLLVVLCLWVAPAAPSPYVEMTCPTPVVLDAPMTFTATLHQPDSDYEGPFVFKWSDNASPAHWREQKVDGQTAILNLTYPSGMYEGGKYRMEVSVYVIVAGIYRERIAEEGVDFELTETLNGDLFINGNVAPPADPDSSEISDDYLLVSTSNITRATVTLKDPTNFLKNATLSYFWFVNDTSYGQTVAPSFSYKFKEKSFSNLEVTVVANFHNNKTNPRGKTSRNDLPKSENSDNLPPSKKAVFRASLKAADPTKKLNVTGETWIKHGDMVDLTVTCDGTGPWYSCWDHISPDYNVTGNETCRPDEVILMEDSCQFSVLWYFSKPDAYGFLVRASNGLSGTSEVVTVNVYEVHKQVSLSFVLAPVLSSVAIIIIGAAAYIFYRHYSTNSSIETADFDFSMHDEDDPDLEDRTFFERLRDSMMNVFSSTSDSLSHVSSTASSVNGHHHHHHGSAHHGDASASANIHYGSIS